METETLYPEEFQIAREVVGMINEKTGICLPEGEIGFIALHIHSALTNRPLSEVNQHSQLMSRLVQVIEESFQMKVNKESVHYLRLIRHIRFTIDRINREEQTKEPEKLMLLLKNEYPLCYNTAWKLIKILQQILKNQFMRRKRFISRFICTD